MPSLPTRLLPFVPALVFAAHAAAAALVLPNDPPADTRYEQALADLRAQHWAAAYARFARLADAGHAPSAAIAAWMHAEGRAAFGSEWSATPAQQRRWAALAERAQRHGAPSDDLASAE